MVSGERLTRPACGHPPQPGDGEGRDIQHVQGPVIQPVEGGDDSPEVGGRLPQASRFVGRLPGQHPGPDQVIGQVKAGAHVPGGEAQVRLQAFRRLTAPVIEDHSVTP